MKKKVLFLILFAFILLPGILAFEPEEVIGITASLDAGELQPVVDTIQPLFTKLSVVVGGIFGLYVILILVRIHYERKKVKILKDIRYDLDKWNLHHGISYSRQKRGFFLRTMGKIKEYFSTKKTEHFQKKIEKLKTKPQKKKGKKR